MNLIRILSLTTTTISLAILPCGCSRSHSDSAAAKTEHAEKADAAEAGVTFKAGKGLHVPPETAKFVGLRVEDVTERKVTSTLKFNAQVYRSASAARFAALQGAASTTALASGQINRSDTAVLRKVQTLAVRTASGDSFSARVAEINELLGTNASRVEVLLSIEDAKGQLAYGTSLSAEAATGTEKTVVAVPKAALLRTAEGTFVYTVSGDRFVRAPVKLGVVNHEFAEVIDGLYAGDQIAVHPVTTLWMAELQSIRGGQACADGH